MLIFVNGKQWNRYDSEISITFRVIIEHKQNFGWLDRWFEGESRKFAIIVDNCIVHSRIDGLKAVELVFLPPNITSKTVLEKYRRKTIWRWSEQMARTKPLSPTFSIFFSEVITVPSFTIVEYVWDTLWSRKGCILPLPQPYYELTNKMIHSKIFQLRS